MGDLLAGYLREFNHKRCDWTIYSARLEQYFIANAIDKDDRKRAMLLNACDEDSYALIYNMCIPEKPEQKSYKQLKELFNSHFAPMKSCFPERYKFYNAFKSKSENVQEWAARVRNLAAHCEFGSELPIMLRDRFIMGFGKGHVMDRLFEENVTELKFEKAITIATNKDACRHNYDLQNKIKQEPCDIYRVRDEQQRHRQGQPHQRHSKVPNFGVKRNNYNPGTSNTSQKPSGVSLVKCKVCGKMNHQESMCRYRDYFCNICKIKGHLAPMCRNKNIPHKQNFLKLDAIDLENDVDCLFNIEVNTKSNLPIFAKVKINNILINFEIDSGSSVTAISHNLYNKYFRNTPLENTNKYLLNYTGGKINPLGLMNVVVEFNNLKCNIDVYVVEHGGPPLLGRDFLRKFNIQFSYVNHVQTNSDNILSLKKEFENSVFSSDLGTFTEGTLKLKLKDNAVPKFCKPRPLPFAIKNKVDEELNRLIAEKIIIPVNYSEWGTPIVPVIKKNNSVRICGDYKITLNPMLEIDQYPLPRIEELFAKLQGGEKFTKLDLSQAYQQIPLDAESCKLTTISTHRGLFKYTRLPYGVASAPALFQKLMDSLLQGLPGVVVFLDDILCTGPNDSEHIKNLSIVLNKLAKCGLRVQKEKCEFMKKSVNYLGFIIDKEGLHTCPDKILAIQNAPIPTNVTQLKSILGLINYYNKFVPNSAKILKPLYNLLKVNVSWEWSRDCEIAFQTIKSILTSDNVLVHYNPKLPIKLTVDASAYGIGAVISHVFKTGCEKPIAYASRTLSASEQNYSHIEKEALAIIFGVNRFYQYLYARKFILVTDHKPLVTIFGPKTGIPVMAASRLQRWAVILANFNYSIEYIKSEENKANFLSRLPLLNNTEKSDENYSYLNYIKNNNDITVNFDDIVEETKNDKILSEIYKFILNGWPNKIEQKHKYYFMNRFQLSIQDGCILLGYKVVIPIKLQSNMLNQLHESHLGMVKMKSLARSYVWWPNINKDIEEIVKSCEGCAVVKSMPERAPLQTWPYPDGPWERLHIDYLGPFHGKFIFILMDAYTKWIEAFFMNNITAQSTIQILRSTFARFGLPKHIVSDNGTQLTSEEFTNYLKCNGIQHTTTASYYPATNGAAENCVKTIKNALTSALHMHKNNDIHVLLNKFLLNYRNTAHCTTGQSPAELMFGRSLRTRLDLIKPQNNVRRNNTVNDKLRENVEKNQNRQKYYYGGKRNVEFVIGESVFVRNYRPKQPKWILAQIVKYNGFRNYMVNIKSLNQTWKRHVNQIRKTSHPFSHKKISLNCNTKIGGDSKIADENHEINLDNDEKIVIDVDNDVINVENNEKSCTDSENTPPVKDLTPRRSKRNIRQPERYNSEFN